MAAIDADRPIPRPIPDDRGVAVSKDGSRIAWYRYGSGEPVVLFIPTWNLVDARVVGHQVEYLRERCTVITYDPRGAGASDRPAHGYGFPLHAADAVAVLDSHRVAHASIVAASRAISSAVIVAAEHGRRVDRLGVIAPFLPLEPRSGGRFWEPPASYEGWDLFNAFAWRTHWPAFVRFFMRQVFTEPDSDATIDDMVAIALDASPEVLITQEAELDWTIAPPLIPKVACPTLLIHGDSDVTGPVAGVEEIARLFPNVRLELIAGGGHRPDIRTPARVNPLLGEFLLAVTGS